MTCIITVFLAVPLQMLIAFEIIKGEFFVVVDLIVIMHGFTIRSKKCQDIVVIKALHIFMFMSCVVCNGFVPIETKTCTAFVDRDDSIIPVYNRSSDQQKMQILTEWKQHLRCTPL